ncbi:MAG TPA: hypothetical protein VFS30_06225 [Dehalococcoidia bacterium]|nr:hypothetical protein [Dehalococcoidia bacterium]
MSEDKLRCGSCSASGDYDFLVTCDCCHALVCADCLISCMGGEYCPKCGAALEESSE